MTNIRLTLEYNGAGFHGWQKQPGLRTIQGELHKVLEMVLRCPVGELCAAGRTDAGVHAHGQVANFKVAQTAEELPQLRKVKQAVSHILRGEVAVLKAEYAPEEFNARAHALSKQYSYLILRRDAPAVLDRGRAWFIFSELDLPKMREAARALLGVHDFSSFRGPDSEVESSVREILESEISWNPPFLTYRVVGRGFLKQMVRNIVGTLVGLGKGSPQLKSISEILEARDRRVAGITAPPYGLYLDWVKY